MLLMIIVLFAAAALVGVFAVYAVVEQRAEVRSSLRQLDGYAITADRDREMLEPIGVRLAGAVGGFAGNIARRFTPVGYSEQIQHKILLSGSPTGIQVDRILVLKVFGAASGIIWIPLVLALGLSTWLSLVAIGLLWFAAFMAPDISLNRKVEARQSEIRRALPDVLDLLVISVEAGLGFEQALERTSTSMPGPLSDEFRRFLAETRLGSSRADALRALDERTDVAELRSFILAMLQADTFGVSISRILRAQASEMRIRRRQRATEIAQKAPVKMVFPLVLCIFPAIFVVVLLPALIQIADTL